jgi:hypothetical protein
MVRTSLAKYSSIYNNNPPTIMIRRDDNLLQHLRRQDRCKVAMVLLIILLCVGHGTSFSSGSNPAITAITEKRITLFRIDCYDEQTLTRHRYARLWSSKLHNDESRDNFLMSSSSSPNPLNNTSANDKDSSSSSLTNTIEPAQEEMLLAQLQSRFRRMIDEIPFIQLFSGPEGRKKLPPVQVDDVNVLLYDIILLVNLSLSISFWVTHRLDFSYLPFALNEGCLFSILWILSGLYHGSFLHSAMDGHYPLDDPKGRGGPNAAAALAFNTYINAVNLRLVAALVGACLQHRKVGMGDPMEDLIPLEIACGIVLMTLWRALHSSVTPRV